MLINSSYLHTSAALPGSKQRLKVGVLLDSVEVESWAALLLRNLSQCDFLEVTLYVWSGGERKAPVSVPLLFRVWRFLDRALTRQSRDAYAVQALPMSLLGRVVRCGSNVTCPDRADIDTLRSADLDVIVNCACQAAATITACARYGLWQFESGGGAKRGGEFSIFWDMYHRNETTSAALVVCVSRSPERVVIHSSQLPTDLVSLYRVENAQCFRRSEILLHYLSALHNGQWVPSVEFGLPLESGRTVTCRLREVDCRPPSNRQMLTFFRMWLGERIRRRIRCMVSVQQWFIAVRRSDSLPLGRDQRTFTLIWPPNGKNYADPFLFDNHGQTYLFFESWPTKPPRGTARKGVICCCVLGSDGIAAAPATVLECDYHLSYPQVFEHGGEIYMLPETRESGRIELFRSQEFPVKWELAHVLLDIPGVDPTIFVHAGKVWLFVAGVGKFGNPNGELFLYFSDTLFGNWQPHPRNPVVCDIARARPAGCVLFYEGHLVRPSQDCRGQYGRAVCFNRIDVLTESDYSEKSIGTIEPDWLDGNIGTHTFNRAGSWQVLDGRRVVPRFPILRSRHNGIIE